MKPLKIIYMGTPDFAVPCLERLAEENYEICCVVTQPDKPQGRKQILTPSKVKTAALNHGLNVYQPSTLKTQEAYEYLKAFEPDFIIVAAYGKIRPKNILDLPKYACINVHGSLLPEYRGAAPIQRSVLNGDKVTGITTMLMGEGLDTGDMLLKLEYEIGENETAFTIQPEARRLIERYRSPGGLLVFEGSTIYNKVYSLVYRYMGKVARLAGVSSKVSYYSARKSFVQHGYDLGIQIETIEYCIGHSMKTNRPICNYFRIMQRHADAAMRRIFDSLL